MPWVAFFFDVDQYGLERESWMRKDLGEINQVMKYVEQLSPLRAATLRRDFAPFTTPLDEQFLAHDRFHDAHVVILEQGGDLEADRAQPTVLNFHQLVAHHRVDAVTPDA